MENNWIINIEFIYLKNIFSIFIFVKVEINNYFTFLKNILFI